MGEGGLFGREGGSFIGFGFSPGTMGGASVGLGGLPSLAGSAFGIGGSGACKRVSA